MASVYWTNAQTDERGTVLGVRRGVAAVAAILVAVTCAGAVHADGDPASDVLPIDLVYLPISGPSREAAGALRSAVAAVYARGDRIRVAVIATREDLGAIPSLMNKPDAYARFLGQELGAFYVGPLLIVMPRGWGIYDGGRSVTSETGVLGRISVQASSVDDLVRSAAAAVQKLEAAGALKSRDIRPPYVYPQSSTVHPGKTAVLSFRVLDDSDRAAVAVSIVAGGRRLASLGSPLGPTNYPNARSVSWAVPRNVVRRGIEVCMTATDAAGNRSHAQCMPLRVAR
jgi:hypothetical protein